MLNKSHCKNILLNSSDVLQTGCSVMWITHHIAEKERLLSPLLVVDALSNSSTATLGEVRSYLLSVLQTESELTEQERQLIDKYRQETERIRSQISAIQTRFVGHIACYNKI
jgi:hypothetical protein